ncbi:hypothetical protein BN12_200029 [Nostocoides japonicum T1-X7]|uniref:Uncharacterized protein n=1 Tax=Nostocoides japonicum T1-X7 TaxID=1194083 RepID=A0A077LUK1_9MICO|nr:hypothetical protein BN12_200029 [Tetrasphaera japonica T1-X7]
MLPLPRVLPDRRSVNSEPFGDRQHALAARPGGSNSFYFLVRQRGSTTSTRVLDDIETLIEHERRRRLKGRRSLDPCGIKAIQPAHVVQVGWPRDHPSEGAMPLRDGPPSTLWTRVGPSEPSAS